MCGQEYTVGTAVKDAVPDKKKGCHSICKVFMVFEKRPREQVILVLHACAFHTHPLYHTVHAIAS